jgi:hypothetical protein
VAANIAKSGFRFTVVRTKKRQPKPKSEQEPRERAYAPVDLYPGYTGKLPRSDSINQLAEYVLALYGRLSELASAAAMFEEATDPPGFQTVYGPYKERNRPQKPVSVAPPVNRTDSRTELVLQPGGAST